MEVQVLDPTTFYPRHRIGGWSSMIWTERFQPAGQFELKTENIEEALKYAPEDSLITLKDSKEVMMVEDFVIETNDDDHEEATITGRTIEAPWLENRYLGMGPYKETWKAQQLYTAQEAAAAVTWDSICNTTGSSILRNPLQTNDPKNAIPRVQLIVTGPDTNNVEWWFENGQVYPIVTDFLTRGGVGVRNIRPLVNDLSGADVSDKVSFAQNGAVSRHVDSFNAAYMHMEFYSGVDRRREQSVRPSVIFDERNGILDNPQYLWSNKNLKQMVKVDSKVGSVFVYADPVAGPNLTGTARKGMYLDGGDPGSTPLADFLSGLRQKGEIELKKYNRMAAMETGIAENSPYIYDRDYRLGDLVTVRGKYGFRQTMQVVEYVRGSNGVVETGAPTLTLPT